MTEDDLERRLREAFDARARASVGENATPPRARFASAPSVTPRHRRVRLLAPLAAAAAVLAVVGSVLALQHSSAKHEHHDRILGGPTAATGEPVHIKLLNSDGSTYGVGMPVVAFFSRKITEGRSLSAATSITVNGKRARAAWYFEPSSNVRGYPIEAHLRMSSYWPAHSQIHVVIATRGVPAGKGLAFDDSLTLDFVTGPRNVAVVNDATHRMTVSTDGKTLGSYPVSLGANSTPTSRGTKVIIEKGDGICMSGPGYHECGVKYTQRLTYSGEYLHAAPWNLANIKRGVDTSNGCTNLTTTDARTLYNVLEVGDVVEYPNADGPTMKLGSGYGDWNVPWSTWLTGGLVPTR
jgi:lipoprotein-anchoring transpeptidase ErfK/SrfK